MCIRFSVFKKKKGKDNIYERQTSKRKKKVHRRRRPRRKLLKEKKNEKKKKQHRRARLHVYASKESYRRWLMAGASAKVLSSTNSHTPL